MKYLIIQSLNVSNIKKKLIVMIKFEKEVKLAYFLINIIMRYNALIDKVNEILLITIWQTKKQENVSACMYVMKFVAFKNILNVCFLVSAFWLYVSPEYMANTLYT